MPPTGVNVRRGGHDVCDMCCILCQEQEAMVPRGFCATCLHAAHAEIELGLFQLVQYLTRWAEFTDWCETRGLAAC
jgi:hypothetical protein